MRFNSSASRLVIICGPHAYKIALFRFCRLLKLLSYPFRSREWQGRLLGRAEGGKFRYAVLDYLMPGIRANGLERALYLRSQDRRLCPTHACRYWGLLGVQDSGRSMHEGTPWHQLFPDATAEQLTRADLLRTDQFCTIGSSVVLVDYGNRFVGKLL